MNFDRQLEACSTLDQLFAVLLENLEFVSYDLEEVLRRIKRYLADEAHIESIPNVDGIRTHLMRIQALTRLQCHVHCHDGSPVRHFGNCCVRVSSEQLVEA